MRNLVPLTQRLPSRRIIVSLLLIASSLAMWGCTSSGSKATESKDSAHAKALRQAKEQGTVAALRQVINDYPNTSSAEEAKASLAGAMLREARTKNSADAYREVIKEFPDSSSASEARTSLHTMYERSLSDFRQHAARTNARMLPFMEKLVAHLEKTNDSTVEIRYRERPEPPSGSFTQYEISSRNSDLVMSTFKKSFADFNNGTLTLKDGSRYTDPNEMKNVTKPTIFLDYSEWMNNTEYRSSGSDSVFGTDATIVASMRIPNDATSFDFTVKGRTPANFSAGPDNVYIKVTDLAMDQLVERLYAMFIQQPAK